jgi:RNA-directed DNA polymerase
MLMERIVSSENVLRALERVEKNKGSHGVDEMPVTFLRQHLRDNGYQPNKNFYWEPISLNLSAESKSRNQVVG